MTTGLNFTHPFSSFTTLSIHPSLSPLDLVLAVVAEEGAEHGHGEELRRVGLGGGHAVAGAARLHVGAAQWGPPITTIFFARDVFRHNFFRNF